MSFTERFSERAGAYVSGRPSYPPAAIALLFAGLGDPADVLAADLGAGTGISSRALADTGARVLAIEPNAKMREAAEPHPRVEWIAAPAEHTGLAEAEIDLVTAFQAFHWFDPRATLDEIVRILRPAGRAALVYNERDESDPFTAAYGDLVRTYQTDDTERRRADALETFAAFEAWKTKHRAEFRNQYELDVNGVLARAKSTSYLPQAGDIAIGLHDELRRLVGRFAGDDGKVVMVMRTIVLYADIGTAGG